MLNTVSRPSALVVRPRRCPRLRRRADDGPGGRGPGGGHHACRRAGAWGGARHVRHRELTTRIRRDARDRDRGRPLGGHDRLPHGRIRRHRARPPGRIPEVDPGTDRRTSSTEGGVLRRRARATSRPPAPAMPTSWPGTLSTCAAWASGRTGTWPSTTRAWPTSTTRSTSRWSSSTPHAGSSRSTRGTSPTSPPSPHTPSP